MSLGVGSRLGPYEILASIGAGGMGQVFRARDTRLGRDVAVKVLPAELASRPDLRQRFEREARVVSSLNHPHICTLHDIGSHEGLDYIVMEFLDGLSLGQRLAKGPMPMAELLTVAIQMADGLDQAHRHGVVHRDLKPANVMLTRGGAKLLDFGLAKVGRGTLLEGDTATAALTIEGAILGTLQYMSPEQLQGKDADPRSDIFAFGALLYEMATGKRAFDSSNQASVIASILNLEPPAMTTLVPLTPSGLERVVQACMAKDPLDRWQSARDLLRQLRWLASGVDTPSSSAMTAVPPPAPPPEPKRNWLAWALAGVFAATTAALGVAYLSRTQEPLPTLKLSVLGTEKGASGEGIALSPDGRRLAFTASGRDGRLLIWIRPLDSLNAQPLSGTDDATFPFWSPDGGSIGFFQKGKLKRINLAGGSPQVLCDAPAGRGGAWSKQGTIVFSPNPAGALFGVAATGGQSFPVTKLDTTRKDVFHRWACFLEDGRRFLFQISAGNREKTGIYSARLEGQSATDIKFMAGGESTLAWSPSGHLLFVKDATLMAQTFNAGDLKLEGAPFRIADNVPYFPPVGADFTVSANGILAYKSGASATQLTWLDDKGRTTGLVGTPGDFRSFELSPEEKRLALDRFDTASNNRDIWTYDFVRGTFSRLTFEASQEFRPVWSPDGSRIVFSSDRTSSMPKLFLKHLNSGEPDESIWSPPSGALFPAHWSADGKYLVFESLEPTTKYDLWILPMEKDAKGYPLLQSQFNERDGRFSPDGRWIAYTSDETGIDEIYVRPFRGSGQWQISTNGGLQPRWHSDGKALYFLAGRRIAVAEIQARDGGLVAGVPRELFDVRVPVSPTGFVKHMYGMTRDGKQFLINSLPEDAFRPITVITNWTAALK